MPMAVSLLAGGVIWRVVYEQSPKRGLLNAGIDAVARVVHPPGDYAGAIPSVGLVPAGKGLMYTQPVQPGAGVALGVVGLSPEQVPKSARPAAPPATAGTGEVAGVVFRDFKPGGGGTRGVVDEGELGLPGTK